MLRLAAALALFLVLGSPATAQACQGRSGALGVARTIEIDATNGPIFGEITKATREASFLASREVVLTFDDGPMPWITGSILDTLDQHCTKATFFSVGRMAIAYPEMVREILRRGHTLGTHTWSHPLNIARLPRERAVEEIERGFAAVALAAGRPIAPFFRFPGLSDSAALLAHLQGRGIASFTVDVVSNDSFIGDPHRLTQRTLQLAEQRGGGIVLFHDIKAVTAKALPGLLGELARGGYRVVHLKAVEPMRPVADYDAELGPRLAKVEVGAGSRRQPLPFFGDAATLRSEPLVEQPVTRVAPEARQRHAAAGALPAGPSTGRGRSARRGATHDDVRRLPGTLRPTRNRD